MRVGKTLVTFALRQEGAPFARTLSEREVRKGLFFGRLGVRRIAICWLGIGFGNRDLLAWAISNFRPDLVLNSGFAGGIRSLLEAGDFVLARNCTSPELLERIAASRLFAGSGDFVSLTEIASPETKARLGRETNALGINMESERLTSFCRENSVPLLTARMISDRSDEAIPGLLVGQGMRTAGDILQAVRFAGRMLFLRERLANRVGQLIEELG